MTAIRFILLKISILICFSSFGQINDTWDAVKVGTTDMQKIYVGSDLVWKKSGCEYGDLDNYSATSISYSIETSDCGDILINSLQTARSALDLYRNQNCTTNAVYGNANQAVISLAVGNYVLKAASFEPICELSLNDRWGVVGFSSIVRNSKIVHIESGIITYVEYY